MPDKPWNVLFIMTDQQRADTFGPDRHPCADFPSLEKLAGESAVFENAFTAASPCVPSRLTFLTGRQPWAAGAHGNGKFRMEDDEPTSWMGILRRSGYASVSIGKTHGIHAGSHHIQIPALESFGTCQGWDHFHPQASTLDDELYFDLQATGRACEALTRLSGQQPFAMFLGLHAPHEPYVMPERYLHFRDPEKVPLPKARADNEYATKSTAYRNRANFLKNKFGEISDAMVRRGIAAYFGLMSMVDDCVGRVMETLQRTGLHENTLVVFASDHGELLGEHYLFNKAATFYEGEVRIPLMLRFPGGAHAGRRFDALVSSVDVAPTILDFLNAEADVAYPGHSMRPVLEAQKPVRDHVTCATLHGMMYRTPDRKLWLDHRHGDGEMYDLKVDPDELCNLYAVPDRAEMRAQLTERMLLARMREDQRGARPTQADRRRQVEVWSGNEPEVVI